MKTITPRQNKTIFHNPGMSISQVMDMLLITPVSIILLPVMFVNTLICLVSKKQILKKLHKFDALGRPVCQLHFSKGVVKASANLLQVLSGQLRICGATCSYRLNHDEIAQVETNKLPSGLISLHDVHLSSGLAIESPFTLYQTQMAMGFSAKLAMALRFVFNQIFFKTSEVQSPSLLPLFGLKVNNTQMSNAIEWFCNGTFFRGISRNTLRRNKPRVSFFINANSINQAQRDQQFKKTLLEADCLFADGSGMRLAAQSRNLKLLDNINGTDVLPLLCDALQKQNKRIFLLGAKPGVAHKMAQRLSQKWPDLQISGIQHGFFSENQEPEIIERINASGTDVLLVAQGSPLQETWIIKHIANLQCQSVLAVGGLFDFYSGEITRAPLWMRETGLEWVWRLSQEPVTKFKRYVLGVPEFMFRTFILKQACQE